MNRMYRRLLAAGLVMAVAGGLPAGPLARAADTAPQAGVALAAGTGTPGALVVTGTQVFTSWTNGGTSAILATGLSYSGIWVPAVTGANLSGEDFEALGQSVLTPRPAQAGDAAGLHRYLLSTSSGSREVTSTGTAAHLQGAGLIHEVDGAAGPVIQIEPVTGARVLVTFPAGTLVSASGVMAWSLAGTRLTGVDLTNPAKGRSHDLPCAADSIRVNSRWVLYHCPGEGTGAGQYVDDLDNVVPTFALPLESGDGAPVLGYGVAAWSHTASGVRVVTVADLNDLTHTRRSYGPLGAGREPAAFDSVRAVLAYVDPDGTVRRIDLPWVLPSPATPDVTPPALVSAGVGAAVTRGPVTFSWSYTDPAVPGSFTSGISSYEAQEEAKQPDSTYSPWQGLGVLGTTTSVEFTQAEGIETCFRVRARDKAGNVTGWSPVSCSVLDLTPPFNVGLTGPRVAAGTSLPFGYQYSDQHGIVSYDLEYKEAPLAVGAGPWSHPASWVGAKVTSVVRKGTAGSDTCFHVRARDVAGNVSGWSDPLCEAVPLDDKSLVATGKVKRVATAAVPSGQVSTMTAAGDALTFKGVRAHELVLVGQVGPGQGTADVYIGSTWVGRASFSAARDGWGTVSVPYRAIIGGPLKIVRLAGTRNVTIDGVGLLQQ